MGLVSGVRCEASPGGSGPGFALLHGDEGEVATTNPLPMGVAAGVPAGLDWNGSPVPTRPAFGNSNLVPHVPVKECIFDGLDTGVPAFDIGCRWEASPMAAGLKGHGFLTGDVPARLSPGLELG